MERAWISAPSSSCTAGLTVPVSFSSQTSLGITRASSFSTRSQSKRLWARLATVVVRLCWTARKSVNARRLSALTVAAASSLCRRVTSDSRSEICLLVRATAMIPIRPSASAPSST